MPRRRLQVDKTQDHHSTDASIYVPSKDKVKDADITHLMAVGDVALRCNGLKLRGNQIGKPESPCQTTRNLIQKTNMYIGFLWTNRPKWKVHTHERY
jgi:hypothetical protein